MGNSSGFQVFKSESDYCGRFADLIGKTVSRKTAGGMPEIDFLPIDFQYGGNGMRNFLDRCNAGCRREADRTVWEYKEPESGLTLEFALTVHPDHPVCEWHTAFSNRGTQPTLRLSHVRSLHLAFPESGEAARLLRGRGSFNTQPQTADSFQDSFLPVTDDLTGGAAVCFGARAGRCSDPWMPFFNLKFAGDGGGLVFAVGWPGQWDAVVGKSLVDAGNGEFDSVLLPGERFDFPSMFLLRYDGGDMLRGSNLLRRFLYDVITPHYDGKAARIPVACGNWGGLAEPNHMERVRLLEKIKLPVELYWIDAGWYAPPSNNEFDPEWSSHVGDWEFNAETWPNGVRPISDAVHALKMKFLLWVEPERAIAGSKLPSAHPEWFLGEWRKGGSVMLDLGNRDACDWCIEYVSELIRTQKLDVYREDFNMDPLNFWRSQDRPGRKGVTEFRAVAGLYRFWGELRRRFPNLLIDNCSSGGRRLNIELLRYSVPFWSSDMQCYPAFNPDCAQSQTAGLSLWLPIFGNGTQNREGGDTYLVRSSYSPGIVWHCIYDKELRKEYPFDWLKERLAEFYAVRDLFTGDFYPLTGEINHAAGNWSASQYDRPDLKRGLILAYRREGAVYASADLRLRGLDGKHSYRVCDLDSGCGQSISGDELMTRGLHVEMPEARSSRILTYELIEAQA